MNKIKLGELLRIKHGFAFKSENYVAESPYALVTLANISEDNNFQFNRDKTTFYGADFPDDFMLKPDDLIMPLTEQVIGLFGNSAFVPKKENFQFVLNQRVGKVIPNDAKADKYYLHYLLSTKIVREQLEYRASGTRQRNISPDDVYDVTVYVPDVDKQRAIGKVLYTLEQKVNANRQINDNLQQQLKLMYDYWFTQFDFPDENGKPYRSSGGKMVWNDVLKRDVPAIFQCVFIKDVVQRIATGLNPRDNFTLGNGKIRYVTVKNLTIDGSIDFSGCDRVDEKARQMIHNRSGIQIGDILFASIAPLGRCHLIQEEPTLWDINESVFTIRSNDMITSEYLYSFLSGDAFVKRATSNSTGSIFKGIRINTLLDTPIIVPPKKIADAFSEKAKKLLRARHVNAMETERLIELRDWLLPMLMNGQATITD